MTNILLRGVIAGTLLLMSAGIVIAQNGGTAYVSPTGSDNNPGTLTQPYLTIQKCATTVTGGGTCLILAGDYQETVTPNSGITIAPYQNQTVTVDGTNPVTGWTLYSGNIYRAQVTLSSGDTNQLFVNGQMMTEAQWPLSYNLFQPVWATAQNGTNGTTLVDSNLPDINWVGARVHFWSGTDPWDPQTGAITQSQPGQLTFTVDGASFPPYIVPQTGGYYFLFGALGALTAPSEWFYDSNAGYLYLWAPGGVDPNTVTVSAKVRQYGFDLSNASGVTIRGLNLFATTINTNSSSTNNLIDGITATYVSHYTTLVDNPPYPSSYWYDHLGDSGIVLDGTGNVLENSTISYSAGNGVTVYGINETVQNNLIHHVDYMANYGAGVAVEGAGNVITRNTIHDASRFAIFPHNIFNYLVGATNLDISYNNLFNAMLVSRDGGEIYTGSPPCVVSSTIRYNWLHDTRSFYNGPADNYPLAGVYLDEDTCGWQVYQNIAWNNEYHNIFLGGSSSGNTTPNDNQIYNNSIPDSSPTGYIWLFNLTACGTTAVYNNYVLVSPVQTGSACNVYNNGATAPGADMMSGIIAGCNFGSCTSTLLATQIATLTVMETGTGSGVVTSSPPGISCGVNAGPQCDAQFALGAQVTLTASASTGSSFTGWSEGGCSGAGPCVIDLSANTTVTATFAVIPPVTLTVAETGTGAGQVTSIPAGINCSASSNQCAAPFALGTQVTLTGSASAGSSFSGWSGAGCSGTSTCVVTMNAAQTVTATFTVIPSFMLSVVPSGAGSGTVISTPSGIACGATCNASFQSGTQVTLSAAAGSGSTFAGWSGGGCSGDQTCTVTLGADTTVTASFAANSAGNLTLVAAVLPTSRSIAIGGTATAFATLIDAGPADASTCTIASATSIPASFVFQTTDPTTNALTGTANTPVNITAGQAQSFVIAFAPTAAFPPTNVAFTFTCANAPSPAATTVGVDTLNLSASTTPVPDIVALAASGDPGYVDIPGATGTGVFAVATVNLGIDAAITAAANTGTANLPVTLTICQTNPTSGACLATPAPTATTDIQPNATPTFGIFVTGSAAVANSPGVNRVFLTFTDANGVLRGETSVAVRTQ
jgi:hypothetical protein